MVHIHYWQSLYCTTDAYPSTDIDRAVAAATNGSICITCHFTPGTTIQGCAVVLFSDDYNLTKLMENITRAENAEDLSASKCMVILMEGNYTVEVYVLDSSGRKGDIPLYILQTSIPLHAGLFIKMLLQ